MVRDGQRFEALAERVLPDGGSDRERVLAALAFSSGIETVDVRLADPATLDTLDDGARRRALLYRRLPLNLIPPGVVLRDHLSYSGPCGAKSKLLIALLDAADYEARLNGLNMDDFTPQHSIVEVRLDGVWIPLDPTFGLRFEDADGELASTAEVAADRELFLANVERYERDSGRSYPEERYVYTNVSAMSVFYVVFTVMRKTGLVELEDAGELYVSLDRFLPASWLRLDLGAPFVYERPELLFLCAALAMALLCAVLLWRRSRAVESPADPP